MIIDICLRLNQDIRFSKYEKYTMLIENRDTVGLGNQMAQASRLPLWGLSLRGL